MKFRIGGWTTRLTIHWRFVGATIVALAMAWLVFVILGLLVVGYDSVVWIAIGYAIALMLFIVGITLYKRPKTL